METNSMIGDAMLTVAFIGVFLSAILNAILLVFLLLYVFKWDKMRAWFNKKAGIDFMQQDRLEADQVKMLLVGLAIGVLIALCNIFSFDSLVGKLEAISFVGVLIWAIVKYRQEKGRLGGRGALWCAIFNFLVNTTVVSLAVFLSYMAIFLFVVMLLFGGISSASLSSMMGSGSSSTGPTNGILGKTEDGDDVVLEKTGDNSYRDEYGKGYSKNLDGSYYRKDY